MSFSRKPGGVTPESHTRKPDINKAQESESVGLVVPPQLGGGWISSAKVLRADVGNP